VSGFVARRWWRPINGFTDNPCHRDIFLVRSKGGTSTATTAIGPEKAVIAIIRDGLIHEGRRIAFRGRNQFERIAMAVKSCEMLDTPAKALRWLIAPLDAARWGLLAALSHVVGLAHSVAKTLLATARNYAHVLGSHSAASPCVGGQSALRSW
jgi:hypothetical protein